MYRKQLRPVIWEGAEVMDEIFRTGGDQGVHDTCTTNGCEGEFIEPYLPIGEYGPYPVRLRRQFKWGDVAVAGGQWREMSAEFGAEQLTRPVDGRVLGPVELGRS
ncbi:hypothetical protein ACFWN5_25375 [Streptomyces sp. NPDC058430]|uniref:hypothetical protein n=1 Tax=Streptomyces sp. NPDC058430 TaxID=3346495 RepID=UPI0036518076